MDTNDPLRDRLIDDESRCVGLHYGGRGHLGGTVRCVQRERCLRYVQITDDLQRPEHERVRLSTADYLCGPGVDAFRSLMKPLLTEDTP